MVKYRYSSLRNDMVFGILIFTINNGSREFQDLVILCSCSYSPSYDAYDSHAEILKFHTFNVLFEYVSLEQLR